MQDEFHSGTKLVPKVTPVSRKQRVMSCFVEDVNMVRRSLLSLSERGYMVVGNLASQEFVCIRQGKRVGIVAIEIERTRIHFLSEVSVAIAAVVS